MVNTEIKKETMILNMGPQHPSTHGVLRLVLELDGETVINATPVIGYLHTGMEKTVESERYIQAITIVDRMDYLSCFFNELGYILAVEDLLNIEVPERVKFMRVILCELQRIASHLVWLGTHALELGAMSVMLYTFRERELILELFEMCSGYRMNSSYMRVGGFYLDFPKGFIDRVKDFIDIFPSKINGYETLLTKNVIWKERTVGLGILSAEDAINFGVSGPTLRASGVKWDIRMAHPYSGYEFFEFEVPVGKHGDVYDRYLVRMEEMRQSIRIISQAVENLPEGSVSINNPDIILPSKKDAQIGMEEMIHHFKIVSDGFSVPQGSTYIAVESPRGELGFYLVSDGGNKPYRLKVRTPSFANLQALPLMLKGIMISDVVAVIASTDIVLGDVDR